LTNATCPRSPISILKGNLAVEGALLWKPRGIAYATDVLAKYARLVSSTSKGAVTG